MPIFQTPANAPALIDAIGAPLSFAALAAEVVLEQYPRWANFATVTRKSPVPVVVFTIRSPMKSGATIVLELGDMNEGTLSFGDWHTHTPWVDSVTPESVRHAMRDMLDTIEGILSGETVSVSTRRQGEWLGSRLSSRDDVTAIEDGAQQTVTSWLGQSGR